LRAVKLFRLCTLRPAAFDLRSFSFSLQVDFGGCLCQNSLFKIFITERFIEKEFKKLRMPENEAAAPAEESKAETTDNVNQPAPAAESPAEQTAAPAGSQAGAQAEAPQTAETPVEAEPAPPEEISYHAVEKEGEVTAIWEMQGRRHLRTIHPRSQEGKQILNLFTSDDVHITIG
jgi:hypothetical protein